MAKMVINEQDLNKIISESIINVLNESETDEGLWNNLKAGFQGAKQGYQAQKTIDRGTDGFKQYHDNDDARYEMQHPLRKAENTADEQARQIYQQYKQYQSRANQLLAKYNALTKQYGLVKQGVGQRTSAANPQVGGGVNFNPGQTIKGSRNYQPDAQSVGPWGK